MSKANHKFGPAANWSELAEDLDDEHRLFSMPFDDVLVYYDDPIISVGQFKNDPDKSFYLRSEEHTSELQSLMRISYAVFCLKKKKKTTKPNKPNRIYQQTSIQYTSHTISHTNCVNSTTPPHTHITSHHNI